jgi:hypothetical protein
VGSEHLLERAGTTVHKKRGNQSHFNKFRGFGVYSMNKTGGRRKIFITRTTGQVDLAINNVQHFLSPLYSSPLFGVKFIYDLRHGLRVVLSLRTVILVFTPHASDSWVDHFERGFL